MEKNDELKYNTVNELNLKVTGARNQKLIDENCCTCINIILQNDGKIQTSFLGAHNPEIIKNLEHALKVYFKGLKKTLKAHYFADEHEAEEHDECCSEHECGCCDHEGDENGKQSNKKRKKSAKKEKCCDNGKKCCCHEEHEEK